MANHFIRCTLRGSLAATGKGHATDHGITFGLHGYHPEQTDQDGCKGAYRFSLAAAYAFP